MPKLMPRAIFTSLCKSFCLSGALLASAFASETAAPADSAKPLRVFSEPTLLAQEFVIGALGGAVLGAVGFYSGKGLESLLRDSDFKQGKLGFTGVRYTNFDGGFRGGALGISMGAALGAYFAGQLDEEDGSLLWTYVGAFVGMGAGLWAADLMGVEEDYHWKPFLPLLGLPSLGSVVGFNVSRYFRDQRRREITGTADGGLRILPPTLALVPMGPEGRDRGYHVNALNLRF